MEISSGTDLFMHLNISRYDNFSLSTDGKRFKWRIPVLTNFDCGKCGVLGFGGGGVKGVTDPLANRKAARMFECPASKS